LPRDPRDRPFDQRELADELHSEFNHEKSDFLAWLALWDFVQVQKKNLSNSRFRKMCRQRFLSPIRLFEWMEVRRQLESLCREMKIRGATSDTVKAKAEADNYDKIHRALLAGLLANVAVKTETHEYLGTRNRRLQIFPGSSLFKKGKQGPKWIMAAEISQTTRVFARQVASIDSGWVERAAAHLLQKS